MNSVRFRIDRRLNCLYIWLGLLCIIGMGLNPSFGQAQHVHPHMQSAAPRVGAAAVPFQLKTLDGKPANLETFRGKPLVINFFASWCDPCRDEMPVINELATKAGAHYSVIGIAVEDSRGAVTEFATESKLVFPIALDLNSTVKRAYRIFGPPATFFIDAHAIIQDVVLGPLTSQRAREAMKKMGVSP
jgi:cytochrome c biogenesis protein CcmG/thiol:disulfide interchange protein DsbE